MNASISTSFYPLCVGVSSDIKEGGSGSDSGSHSNDSVTTNHLKYALHIFCILVVLFAYSYTYKLACHAIHAYLLIILACPVLTRH